MRDCSDCNFCEVMPDGSLFCAVRDEHVHQDTTCDLWCDDLLMNISKEEYDPDQEDQW